MEMKVLEKEKNKDVFLNFGLIAYGPLSEIERLQETFNRECHSVKVVYQTVAAKRLKLVKMEIGEKT
jgi:hypothetical protein